MADPIHDPLRPHSHEPNPAPPDPDPAFNITWPGGARRLYPADLASLPQTTVEDCYIVSTGHGTSGPFAFEGVALLDLIAHFYQGRWTAVAVISADGFGTRLYHAEIAALPAHRPALLALRLDGHLLTRAEGLVRLIEPNETDDALRQVKWISRIEITDTEREHH